MKLFHIICIAYYLFVRHFAKCDQDFYEPSSSYKDEDYEYSEEVENDYEDGDSSYNEDVENNYDDEENIDSPDGYNYYDSGYYTSDIIVAMVNSTDSIINSFKERDCDFPTRESKATAMMKALTKFMNETQAPLLKDLEYYYVTTKSFSISNEIFIANASKEVAEFLEYHPLVKSVRPQEILTSGAATIMANEETPSDEPKPNIKFVQADKAWKTSTGIGAIIAIIDSGVEYTHSILRENYLGTNLEIGNERIGWYDPLEGTFLPRDSDGHGTLAAGLACGKMGYGVAPDAKWMACRVNFNADTIAESRIKECMEFITCPKLEPEDKNCGKLPDVASCSWGIYANFTGFNQNINAWIKLEIVPVFSIGNLGPECNTTGSPGNQPQTISVGSVDLTRTVSTFSSRGVGSLADAHNLDKLHPTLLAPGNDVVSSCPDNKFCTVSGTSFSGPEVAGAVALMKSMVIQNKMPNNITAEYYKKALAETTDRNIDGTEECSGIPANEVPNFVAGWGILNADAAVLKLSSDFPSF